MSADLAMSHDAVSPHPGDAPLPAKGTRFASIALAVITFLWVLYLSFPILLLQQYRCTLFGMTIPIYYFLIIPPLLAPAFFAMASQAGGTPRQKILCWALPLVLLSSVAASSSPLWSLREWLSWISRGYAVGATYFLLLSDTASVRRVIKWVYVTAAAITVFGLIEMGLNRNPLTDPYWDRNFSPISEKSGSVYRPDLIRVPISARPQGTQGNRVPYTACILPFLSIALWKERTDAKSRWKHLAAALLMLFLILISQSRSAWVGLAVLLAAHALLMLRNNAMAALRPAGAVALMLLGSLLIPATRQRIVSTARNYHLSEVNISHRLASYSTVAALKGRALLGVGYGQYPQVYRPYYDGPAPWVSTPDNQYLRWLIETGIAGSIALFVFLGIILQRGLNAISKMTDRQDAELYKALLAGWAGLAATFLFFDGFYWAACNMTFWALLGLFATCLKHSTAPE